MERVDIAIVGGGMVGLTAALALYQAGFESIAVFESQAFPVVSTDLNHPLSARVSAISPASVSLLTQIGIWQQLLPSRMGVMEQIQVWEQPDKPLHFDAAYARKPALGYIVENDALTAKLAATILQQEGIQLWMQQALTRLEPVQDGYILHVASGKTLHAQLVLGADGAKSWVRDEANIATNIHDYGQHAIVAHLHTTLPHQRTAWQRFDKDQICALLPLADAHQVSLVWSADSELAHTLINKNPDDFAWCLQEQMHNQLGKLTLINKPQYFPLITKRATHYTAPHLALLGDAARSMHPLAGQGVNQGFADVYELVTILQQAKKAKRNIADHYILRRYERANKGRMAKVLLMMDSLFHLYRASNPLVQQVRRLGFNHVAKNQWLKTWLMHQASGG